MVSIEQNENEMRLIEGADGVIRAMAPNEITHLVHARPVMAHLDVKSKCIALGIWESFKAMLADNPGIAEDWELTHEVSILDPSAIAAADLMGVDLEEFFSA